MLNSHIFWGKIPHFIGSPLGTLHLAPLSKTHRGSSRGLVVSVVDCTPIGRRFESASCQRILPPPQLSMTGYSKALVCPAMYVRLHMGI